MEPERAAENCSEGQNPLTYIILDADYSLERRKHALSLKNTFDY